MRRRRAARNLENAKQDFDPTSRWYRSFSAPRPNAAADSRRLADARQGASSKRQCQTAAACAPNPALTGRPMSSTGLRSDTATGASPPPSSRPRQQGSCRRTGTAIEPAAAQTVPLVPLVPLVPPIFTLTRFLAAQSCVTVWRGALPLPGLRTQRVAPAQSAKRSTVDGSSAPDAGRRRVACEPGRIRGGSTRPVSAS